MLIVTVCLWIWLPTAVVQAAYDVTVVPQAGVDQSDATLPETIAWYLQEAHTQGGGTIHLQTGEYQLRKALIIPNDTTLIGSSEGTILRATGEKFFDHLIKNIHSDHPQSDGVKNITLTHLTLIGQRDVRLNCIQLVGSEAQRSNDIVLSDIITHHCGRHGIHIKGANKVVLQNVVSHHNGVNVDHDHNIYLLRVTDATMRNVYTYQAAGNGFSSTRLTDATLYNITSIDNGRRGIRFGAGDHITVQNCTVRRNGLALDHQADGIVIVSDDFDNPSSDITIKHCSIARNRDHGIWVNSASRIRLHNNIISHNPAGDYSFLNSTVSFY
ncbi:MAG: right-handed parallel beta-helix repeat-containing protein [Candidatus Kerfeldbacteria bacterium]|nr:right-handed parallel beta-helix repeat-containing protein [Candidatus Kerfeldbacteria bacterium]